MALVYDITQSPPTMLSISIHRPDAAKTERIETAWSQSVVDEFLIDEVRQIVLAVLARDGYLQAKVDASLRVDADEKVLSIAIDAGARTESHVVTTDVPDNTLRDELTGMI